MATIEVANKPRAASAKARQVNRIRRRIVKRSVIPNLALPNLSSPNGAEGGAYLRRGDFARSRSVAIPERPEWGSVHTVQRLDRALF
ncbi:MAG: hypothetical protein DCC68_03910 [Planctomycetota bacterium]|nr:MAG: hypothetical protein DCC68_03910 [Planctomycetota bacterium]